MGLGNPQAGGDNTFLLTQFRTGHILTCPSSRIPIGFRRALPVDMLSKHTARRILVAHGDVVLFCSRSSHMNIAPGFLPQLRAC